MDYQFVLRNNMSWMMICIKMKQELHFGIGT